MVLILEFNSKGYNIHHACRRKYHYENICHAAENIVLTLNITSYTDTSDILSCDSIFIDITQSQRPFLQKQWDRFPVVWWCYYLHVIAKCRL